MLAGNLRLLVLKLLSSKDMSGYDLMKTIKEKTGRKPSPGSMYPLLEGLKQEGRMTVKEVGRAKRYSITEQGRKELSEVSARKEELMDNIRNSIGVFCTMTGQTETECLALLHDEYVQNRQRSKLRGKDGR
jgi:formylmethanofuran dehydrogenase subunit E